MHVNEEEESQLSVGANEAAAELGLKWLSLSPPLMFGPSLSPPQMWALIPYSLSWTSKAEQYGATVPPPMGRVKQMSSTGSVMFKEKGGEWAAWTLPVLNAAGLKAALLSPLHASIVRSVWGKKRETLSHILLILLHMRKTFSLLQSNMAALFPTIETWMCPSAGGFSSLITELQPKQSGPESVRRP